MNKQQQPYNSDKKFNKLASELTAYFFHYNLFKTYLPINFVSVQQNYNDLIIKYNLK